MNLKKRTLDLFLVIFFSHILLTFLLIISLLIFFFDQKKIFYLSKRVGQNNKIFLMYKFRTMKVYTPQLATHLLKNPDNYLTKVGKLLRVLSLDELPQIINVLKGDMSFVGPRPALYNQFNLIELRTKEKIHLLMPGITGWAQINGRDNIGIAKKVQLDKYYMNHYSFFFDIKILFKTFFKIFSLKEIKH